jgi:levansucrase
MLCRPSMLTIEEQAQSRSPCSDWTAAQLERLRLTEMPEIALIDATDVKPIIADRSLWDLWPVQDGNGDLAEIGGGSLWVMLSAPRGVDPDQRHDEARMRLLHHIGDAWLDCGDLLPDGFAPGSREWSGSTRLDIATGELTLWFTAAGRRGAADHSAEQRLFHCRGTLDLTGDRPCASDWHSLTESVKNDGRYYADPATGAPIGGQIKGFRDPYWFRDPADGQGYLLFTGSKATAESRSDYDGVIGVAAAQDASGTGAFTAVPPVIAADGLAGELERPHVVVHEGRYYLFWSTHSHVFAPAGPVGPTGLYGMVAPSLFGPYQPLNGSGLVLANPAREPRQGYAWQVIPSAGESFTVVSFIDFWGLEGRDCATDLRLKARQFGGTIAPAVTIMIDGKTTRIIAGGMAG